MNALALARAIHVLSVVIWIGGVAMATSTVLPAARRGELGKDPTKAFHAIERRFVWQARIAVLLVGGSGFYMAAVLDLWDRFGSLRFWWMDAMVGVWLLFMIILFAAEPLILHRRFDRWAKAAPQAALARLNQVHWLLLALAAVTVFAAVAGSHGWTLFEG